MNGWKTILFAVSTTLLGVLQSAGVTDIVAAHPGGVTTGVGIAIGILRFVTSTPIFNK